ncbi:MULTISPECIES: hypothetical protein [unclassified Streptomyces]|uniref:hypothetical protein n=1 Tax=unclassified Streptomyces TaxID=2593676 RepID=UPI00131BFF05|nr:hypothetical protein [Streptomyces sp. CB01635]
MSDQDVRKMLREMATGEPVQVTSGMSSIDKIAGLGVVAEQFGYQYVDVRRGNGYVMSLVADPGPQARARAAQNWAQYPDAVDGGALPPFVPDAFQLLKARITFDLTSEYSDKQRLIIASLGITVMVVGVVASLGADTTSFVVAGIVWVLLMCLIPVLNVAGRRYKAKYAARLAAAGFTPVTDERGRLRYLPPGGQLPGHGNPFA